MQVNEVVALFYDLPIKLFEFDEKIDREAKVPYDQLVSRFVGHPQSRYIIAWVLRTLSEIHSPSLHCKCEHLFNKLVVQLEVRQITQYQSQVDAIKMLFSIRRQEFLSYPVTQATLECAKVAKSMEWKAIQEAVQTAVSEIHVNFDTPLGAPREYIRNRVTRILHHLNKATNGSIDCIAKAEELSQDLAAMRSYFRNEFQALDRSECLESHLDGLEDSDLVNLQDSYKRLKRNCARLKEFCQNPGAIDSDKFVLECKCQLERILSNSAYKLLCIDEDHPCVFFAHHMAFALTTRPQLGDAYSSFVQKMSASNSAPSSFAQSLKETEKLLRQKMVGIDRFKVEMESLNNSGQLFEEKSDSQITQVRLVGPGKVVRGQLEPTFPAILQSIENRIFHPKDNDSNPCYGFTLTCLQQFTRGDERNNVIQQMQLQYRYPYSLRAITISPYLPFPIAQKGKRTIEDTFSLLNLDSNFTLTEENERCYFFPQSERSYWHEATSKIVELAKNVVQHIENRSNKEISFYQLVKIGLWTVHEEHSIKVLLSEQKQLPANAKILNLCTCLAGVDRGGNSLAGRLWASGASDVNQMALDVFMGRAMLCEGRPPYEDHITCLHRFTSSVSQNEAHAFVNACRSLA